MTEPRTRNASRTKATIIEAARTAFSTRGYSQVGMREIAVAAGVATSLIDRHFGTKVQLFEAVLRETLSGRQQWTDRSSFGAYMHRVLSKPDLDIQGLIMSVLAAGDTEAREVAARITQERIIAPLAEWLGGADDHFQAVRMNAIVVGYLIQTRYLTPVTKTADERLLASVTDELQRLCEEAARPDAANTHIGPPRQAAAP